MLVKAGQVGRQGLVQARRHRELSKSCQAGEPVFVLGEAVQPDGVGDGDVVQGGEQGAKEGAPVGSKRLVVERGRSRVQAVVHPVVVAGHQDGGLWRHDLLPR